MKNVNNKCRVIKIGKDALYEFLYENFIANHEELMDMNPAGNSNIFAINWETGVKVLWQPIVAV